MNELAREGKRFHINHNHRKGNDMAPLTAAELAAMDPEGLLAAFRETHLKEGHPSLPEELSKNIRPASGRYDYWGRTRGLQEMHIQTVDKVHQFVVDLAVVCLVTDDTDGARRSLELGFATLTNVVFFGARPGQSVWEGPGDCCCSFAELLGSLANGFGFPDLADRFGQSTYCPSSPQYGPGPSPAYGVSSKGRVATQEEITEVVRRRLAYTLEHLRKRRDA